MMRNELREGWERHPTAFFGGGYSGQPDAVACGSGTPKRLWY
ncbi:hypothetical protein [Flavobacterium sp.]